MSDAARLDEAAVEPCRRPAVSLRARLMARLLARLLHGVTAGSLTVELPGGYRRTFAGAAGGVAATMRFHSFRPFARMARRGALGLAESYLAGEWETPDLADVFRFYVRNHATVVRQRRLPIPRGWKDRGLHRLRANTRRGSRRNIAAHYDLGNAFYRLWLDSSMTYSSAIFAHADEPLEAAQRRKNEQVLSWLETRPGHHILEIGCGWGGFAEQAVEWGCRLTGLTLSREQLSYARDRLSAAPTGAVDLRLEDYRDVSGQYDRIASIEMIEAVGERYWPDYFRTLAERLRPGGIAVIQAITIPREHFADYRRRPDFIQRYIFPGGMLPTAEAIESHGRAAGLKLDRRAHFSESYAETLRRWLSRFRANWPEIAKLGFDERFRRMWEYYLIYCAVGFETGSVAVGHYRFVKPT